MVWREERGDECGAARKEGVGGARTRDYRVFGRRQCVALLLFFGLFV